MRTSKSTCFLKGHGLCALLALSVFFLSCSEERKLSTHSPAALQVYEEGVGLWQKFYYKEAKAAFDKALSFDSTFAMAWGRLAVLAWSTQNISQAKSDIAKALSYSRSATQREQLFIRLWDHNLHFKYSEAALVADSLIRLFPKEPEPYLLRGPCAKFW